MVKTCCITGHRDMSEEQTEKIRPVLKEKLVKALDDGFVKFISSLQGMWTGLSRKLFWI